MGFIKFANTGCLSSYGTTGIQSWCKIYDTHLESSCNIIITAIFICLPLLNFISSVFLILKNILIPHLLCYWLSIIYRYNNSQLQLFNYSALIHNTHK